MSQRFVAKQSLTGRRSSINQENKYWAYRTGIELTPWSTDEERARFEKRKRELMEKDAKEQDEVKQASESKEEVKHEPQQPDSTHPTDGGESAIVSPEASLGTGKHDYRPDRQRYSRAAALLERRRNQPTTDCGED